MHLDTVVRSRAPRWARRVAPAGPREARAGGVAAILFLCLFAGQSGQLALTPVLAEVARSFGVSTAAAGQIRTVASVVAAVAALAVGRLSARIGLRTLLRAGLALLAGGAALSLAAQSAETLVAGQALIGAASSVLVAAGVGAAAAWSNAGDRGRVVAWTLVGAPSAWVVAMPAIGVVAAASWRLAFAVPVVTAGLAAAALRRAPSSGPEPREGDGRSALAATRVRAWIVGEVLSYAAWSAVLLYAGALLVESYGASVTAVGVALGVGAAAYIPGTFLAQRIAGARPGMLLVGATALLAVSVLVFGGVRPGVVESAMAFAVLCFLAGGRTYLGSAVGLDLARGRHASAMSVRAAAAQTGWVLGAASGGGALSAGGYPALAVALAVLFAGGAAAQAVALGLLTRRASGPATRPAPRPPGAAPVRGR